VIAVLCRWAFKYPALTGKWAGLRLSGYRGGGLRTGQLPGGLTRQHRNPIISYARLSPLPLSKAGLIFYCGFVGKVCYRPAYVVVVINPAVGENQRERNTLDAFLGLSGHPVTYV